MSYLPTDSNVQEAALQVQELYLPFTITGSATSSSVVVAPYYSAVLFLETAGVNQITQANGALDPGEASPNMGSLSDSGGQFGALVKIEQQIVKIVGAGISFLGTAPSAPSTVSLANTTGLTANGNKIVLNVNSGVAYNTTTTIQGCLHVQYVTAE